MKSQGLLWVLEAQSLGHGGNGDLPSSVPARIAAE